ncbi:hypothetical protein BDZ97DRAFT_320981 [Flammula alnicola]|nr:hypothetical protein BDZ97DRAFT_320981 [Flammula alnicola]
MGIRVCRRLPHFRRLHWGQLWRFWRLGLRRRRSRVLGEEHRKFHGHGPETHTRRLRPRLCSALGRCAGSGHRRDNTWTGSSRVGGGANIRWPTIVHPILVSIAFGFGTPVVAMGLRKAVRLHWRDVWERVQKRLGLSRRGSLLDLSSTSTSITVVIPQPPVRTTTQRQLSPSTPCRHLFLVAIVLTLMAFVADSGYAGTSELFSFRPQRRHHCSSHPCDRRR